MKTLDELIAGDEVVLIEGFRLEQRSRGKSVPDELPRLLVKRVNRVTITTEDGRKWNKHDGLEYGSRGCGYATHIEAWDPDVHPYAEAARKFRARVSYLHNETNSPLGRHRLFHKTASKKLAEQFAKLNEILVALGLLDEGADDK